jgi:DNA-binding transcriptional LysR family regulator
MNTTLDQWEVLQAVVQMGSFAAAAVKLNRSQSTISYAISRLQEQFDAPLLEIKGRRAQLTETGKAMLAEVEPLLTGFRAMEERAFSVGTGRRTEMKISADSLFPEERLFAIWTRMAEEYPLISAKFRRGVFLASAEELTIFGADVCVTALPARDHLIHPILDVRMCGVARSDHSLHRGSKPLSRADLIKHLAVIIEASSGPDAKRQPHNPSQRMMTVNTIEAAIEAVRTGLCFGWLPAYRIEPLLAAGELQRLRLTTGAERLVRLYLARREEDASQKEENYFASLLGTSHEVELL